MSHATQGSLAIINLAKSDLNSRKISPNNNCEKQLIQLPKLSKDWLNYVQDKDVISSTSQSWAKTILACFELGMSKMIDILW